LNSWRPWFQASQGALEHVRLGELIPDDGASQPIAERQELLLWMFSGLKGKVRQEFSTALVSMEIVRSDLIQSRSVFSLNDSPIVSTPRSERVLFERDSRKLYLHIDLGGAFWIPALRAIFSTLLAGEDGVDIRQCALTGSHILSAPTLGHARDELEQAGFEPPSDVEEHELDVDGAGLGDISIGGDEGGSGIEKKSFVDARSGEIHLDHVTSDVDSGKSPIGGNGSGNHRSAQSEGHDSSGGKAAWNTTPTEVAGQKSYDVDTGGTKKGQSASAERSRRTQWMRSYVVPEEKGKKSESTLSSGQIEHNAAIDEAAMTAVIGYEENRKCKVERMPHLNPGYDIISRSNDAMEKRLIEVKGLECEWTDRGVKLTRTQIMNAEEYGDEFWLYVVEHALDRTSRKIHAIQNPFFKASEFWFDYVWREVADETGDALTSLFAPGRKIRVQDWGDGTIVEFVLRGIASRITIDFFNHGRKQLSFNPTTMEPIDD
jgi:Domain of unknown function (DUF3883)